MDMAYDITLWVYYPNQGAAIFFMAAFLATGLYHLWQCQYVSMKMQSMELRALTKTPATTNPTDSHGYCPLRGFGSSSDMG